jgi:parallel beta-helix repeat protein
MYASASGLLAWNIKSSETLNSIRNTYPQSKPKISLRWLNIILKSRYTIYLCVSAGEYAKVRSKILFLATLTLLLASTLTGNIDLHVVESFSESYAIGNNTQSLDRHRQIAKLVERGFKDFEIEELKRTFGVYQEETNYNPVIDGHGTGWRPPTEKAWTTIAHEGRIVDDIFLVGAQPSAPPVSVDHSASIWFPPIGNQDGEGSCVAWAVGYYVKTFQEAKEHNWNLSDASWEGGYYGHPTSAYQDRIFSPDFVYHLINNGVDSGSSFYDAINLVCEVGISSWKEMPYDPLDYVSWPSEEAWSEAPLYRADGSTIDYLLLSTYDDLQSLKNWIASGNLAVIGVDANQYPSLDNDVWTLDNYLSPSVNHANTIVGYDDTVAYSEEGQTRYGAFKIANSWGVGEWENVPDGFYWISYEAMMQRVEDCMFFSDRIGYEPTVLSSFRIDHSMRSECSISIGMGDHDFPVVAKSFSYLVKGGSHPFCANNIVFDVTEFKDSVSTVYGQLFFIKVYDGGTPTTGTIMNFSIMHVASKDTPIATIQGAYVHADVTLTYVIKVPSDYVTIQEAINAAYPNATIEVAAGTYPENVVVNKTVSLIGENVETTIIEGNGKANVTTVTTDNVVLRGFTIRNGSSGLVLQHVENCNVSSNKVIDCVNGILLIESSNCILSQNTMIDNDYNFGVEGHELSHFLNEVNETNTVDGKPILYLVNAQSYLVDSQTYPNTGFVAIVNSTDVIVKDLNLKSNRQGVLLAYSDDSLVQNVTVSNNTVGIELVQSSNNMIYESNITDNDIGVRLYDSVLNRVLWNDFVSNQRQVRIVNSFGNIWDDGYPSCGNFWSDYDGVDYRYGENQDQLGSDGIGDTPYPIDENNCDNYPLMYPFGVDEVSPVTDDDYDGLWHSSNITIILTALDVQSGVAETFYRINDGAVESLSVNGQPCITTAGVNNTLEYWSIDSVDNEELPHKILTQIKLDNIPPTIESLSQTPKDSVSPDQPVKVSANITDSLSEVKSVTLLYTTDGSIWTSLVMTYNDTVRLYEATIPGQSGDTLVTYKLEACDYAGNNMSSPETESYYVIEMVPELSHFHLLLMLSISALLIVIFHKRKR